MRNRYFPAIDVGDRPYVLPHLSCSFDDIPSLTRPIIIAYTLHNVPFHFAKLTALHVGRASHVRTLGHRLHGLNFILHSRGNSALV